MNIRAILPGSALLAALLAVAACGGGGGGGGGASTVPDSGCTGQCATTTPSNLTAADVDQIVAQAAQEAVARGLNATIAVTDRVGNVLGIWRTGAAGTFTIQSGLVPTTTSSGLENIAILDTTLAAVAKAVTGAYLASEGNAFSSRTASHIVQEHFSPHEIGQPGGPLFGVQFSQLPCSDLVQQGTAVDIGPRRSPLGLSADPGGFPLYLNGQPVGGIGVIADGLYSLDLDILDTDSPNHDEIIALAGQFGYAPPADRLADRITADGRTLRYSDATLADFLTDPTAATIGTATGAYVADVLGDYYPGGGARAGTTFGQADSGIEPDGDTLYPGLDAFVLTDGGGTNLYPPTAGAANGGENLTAAEVTQIVQSALDVANRARAQIRRPLNSQARVTISVVGPDGAILAIARTRDAPMFGTDVSLQKARTATFFSSDDAGTELSGLAAANAAGYTSSIADYVTAVRNFVNDTNALTGTHAFADRSGGNLSRPYYPDGNTLGPNGPLSKPYDGRAVITNNEWSPFSTGLQLDLVFNALVTHLVSGADVTDCTGATGGRLANGIQIFPGSVPIYKNGVLVGGVGVSGDGVDQDDMISFLGVYNASVALMGDGIGDSPGEIGNAPILMRADQIPTYDPSGFTQALRYIQCPQNPFLGSTEENVCDGK